MTLVEMLPDLLIREDEEASRMVRQKFIAEGVDVRVNSKCKEVVLQDGKKYMLVEKGETTDWVEFDQLLVAVGREVLGDRAVAVTGVSPSLAASELDDAAKHDAPRARRRSGG